MPNLTISTDFLKKIRNFSIIAHIDHGKSTLTDRFIQLTYKNKEVYEKERLTDVLEIEQERGITIKLQPVQLPWKGYTLNLIDTPGHVDFAYEVSRSLRACEGAILLIDATQGIQAQTISTMLMAIEHDLEIIPVLNKVDIASKELIAQRLDEIQAILGFQKDQVILASGKTGTGAPEILDAIIEKIPDASHNTLLKALNIKDFNKDLAALIFDSFYDAHKGVVAFVRMFSGHIKPGDTVYLANMKQEFIVKEVGIFTPYLNKTSELVAGNVGYIATGIKDIKMVRIGDTITSKQQPIIVPGFEKPKPKVFASMYPLYKEDFLQLKEALEKLSLNDASLSIKSDHSAILGQGFKMGFLGLLHLDITKERLSREFGVETVVTMPSVEYKVELKTGEILKLKGADVFPEPHLIKSIHEPVVLGEIIVPNEYLNNIYELLRQTRAEAIETYNLYSSTLHNTTYIGIKIKLPYAELIKGFFNKLKAVSRGYASLQYDKIIYEPVTLVKVNILVNKQVVPSLSFLEVPEKARDRARKILLILKDNLERQMFPVPLQAAIGGKIIARETIPAYRKNVTAKLYGGDITRKMKLWHNQAKKKKLRAQHIKVNIPHKAFVKIMQDT